MDQPTYRGLAVAMAVAALFFNENLFASLQAHWDNTFITPYIAQMSEAVTYHRGLTDLQQFNIIAFLAIAIFAASIPNWLEENFRVFVHERYYKPRSKSKEEYASQGINLEKSKYFGDRQWAHSVLLWLLIGGLAFYFSNFYLYAFFIGGLSHLIGGILTGDVPWLLWGEKRDYYLEKRHKVGPWFKKGPTSWRYTRIGIQQLLWFLPEEKYEAVQHFMLALFSDPKISSLIILTKSLIILGTSLVFLLVLFALLVAAHEGYNVIVACCGFILLLVLKASLEDPVFRGDEQPPLFDEQPPLLFVFYSASLLISIVATYIYTHV